LLYSVVMGAAVVSCSIISVFLSWLCCRVGRTV
jgi:hypothetical protein